MISDTTLTKSPDRRTAVLDLLILLLAKWYLLIDAGNGVLLQLFGQSVPLSAAYKSLLLLLMVVALVWHQVRGLLLPLLLLLLMMLGPFYSLLQSGNTAGFSYDAGMLLKILSPLLAALYFYNLVSREPEQARQAIHQIMLFSFAILVLNLLLGRLGYGFEAYLPNDYLPDQNLGTKGFFKATNELSALLLVLSGYLFASYWPQARLKFSVVLVCSLFCASSMLTKTGIAGVLLLAILIPLLQSKHHWQRFSRWIGVVVLSGVVLTLVMLWQLPLILETLGIGQKLLWVYQQQGVLGVILSSRDLYAAQNWQLAVQYYDQWHLLSGIGVTGLELYTAKPMAELDPVDLFIWYGGLGLAYFMLWFGWVLIQSYRCYLQAPHTVAAGLLMVNAVLLLVAAMAGHVLTSGMLWIPWGMLNGSLLLWWDQAPEQTT
ncbi:MAG: O-antigen ligase family protein [Gammaproteobacteria bacterium]|nr:O-antigen ligase family protein [Gammaproteobacteria bacterium]